MKTKLNANIKSVLNKMVTQHDDPVARAISDSYLAGTLLNSRNFWDQAVSDETKISYYDPKKIETLGEGFDYWLPENRDRYAVAANVGKMVRYILPAETVEGFDGKAIETFVQRWRALTRKPVHAIAVLSGSDIKKAYKTDECENYGGSDSGKWENTSCMMNKSYQELYVKNPDVISCIVVLDETTKKIRARALVWKLTQPNGQTYCDRIYYYKQEDRDLIESHARKAGWWYKEKQSNDYQTIQMFDGEKEHRADSTILEVKLKVWNDLKHYPYLDTLKESDTTGIFKRNIKDDNKYEYQNTDGTRDTKFDEPDEDDQHDGTVYIDRIGEHRDTDDCVELANGNWELEDDAYEFRGAYYSVHGDAIVVDCYGDHRHVGEVYYSDRMDEYIRRDEAVFVKRIDGYMLEDQTIYCEGSAQIEVKEDCFEYENNWYHLSDGIEVGGIMYPKGMQPGTFLDAKDYRTKDKNQLTLLTDDGETIEAGQ